MSNPKDNKPAQPGATPTPTDAAAPAKKKLKLDVDDVSEVLERKISP